MSGEHEVQGQILEWLTIKHIFHFRNNSGAMKKGKHYVKFGVPGMPDIIAVINGRFIGIEVKGPDGEQSPKQKDFQMSLEYAGGQYILVSSLLELEERL